MPTPIRDLLFRTRSKDSEEGSREVATTPPRGHTTTTTTMNLHSGQHWQVRMPPIKKHMIKGVMVPTARSAVGMFAQRRRIVRIEVRSQATGALRSAEEESLQDDDVIWLRIFRPSRSSNSSGNESVAPDDDDDEDDLDDHSLNDSALPALGNHDEAHHLGKEHKRYSYENVQILKDHRGTVELKLGSGTEVVVRDIKFESEQDAKAFQVVWARMGLLQKERTQQQITKYKKEEDGSTNRALDLEGGEAIKLLVEIVSASNLPVADLSSADPYVIVRMGGTEVHRTKVVSKNLDPIWTLEKGSLFLLEMSPEAFFAATTGMSFVLKDYDSLGSNEILGNASVSLEELLNGTGERKEYTVERDRKLVNAVKNKHDETKLVLRFRKATDSDKEFMEAFRNNPKKLGLYIDETFLPVRAPYSKMLKGQRKKGPKGEALFRVKPFPDPTREEETKWLTEEQIEAESQKVSTHWVESGSGQHGKVYFELVGCDNLPNMDSATVNLRDKTDAFGCIMFEDAIVNSDVVTDSLSPRWPPWCRRAFVFNMSHPTSDILLALFDHDPEMSPAQMLTTAASDLHDPIGRVRINLSKLAPGTTYNLSYPLYYGELKEHRKKTRGTVHVRVRLDFPDVRQAMVAALIPQETGYVSVANKIDFAIAHYTVDGVVDERKFSMNTFTKYIEELESYQMLLDYLAEAALVVWLWRGHFKMAIAGKQLNLPLHSVTAYIWAILVTWNFNLFPSFLLFAIGWILLATNEYVRRNPSHWKSSRSYFGLLRLFLLNSIPPETVPPNSHVTEIEAFEEEERLAAAKREEIKAMEAAHEKEVLAEVQDEIEQAEGEDVDIASGKTSLLPGVSVNPLKPILYPIQKELKKVVAIVRIVRSIVMWEETYYSFWLVTIAFAASLLTCFVPWAFLLRWTLRIAVWVLLGPWMMLVDKYYFQKQADDNEAIRKRTRERYTGVLESALNSRIKNERALKLKSMKRFCFGKFLLNVPIFNEDLYWDSPLPESSAKPHIETSPTQIAERKFGQSLSGDMIPKRAIQMDSKKGSGGGKKRFWRKRFFRRKDKGKSDEESTPLLPSEGDGNEDYAAVSQAPSITRIKPTVSKEKTAFKLFSPV